MLNRQETESYYDYVQLNVIKVPVCIHILGTYTYSWLKNLLMFILGMG